MAVIGVTQRREIMATVADQFADAVAAGRAKAHSMGTRDVCAGSREPGNLHLINGLFDGRRSRLPVWRLPPARHAALGHGPDGTNL